MERGWQRRSCREESWLGWEGEGKKWSVVACLYRTCEKEV